MLQRKQALNLQVNQVFDGLLLAVALWGSHALRYYGTLYLDLPSRIPAFDQFLWMVALIVPFGPLLLEFQGFYAVTLDKPLWRSFGQVLRAGFWMFLVLAASVIFFRLQIPSRSVLLIFSVAGVLVLLGRERLMLWRFRHRAHNEDLREPVVIAGLPGEIAALESGFTKDQMLLMKVVDRIDIETQPVECLVESLHRNSVGHVIFAGRHGQIDKIQEGIEACETEGVEAWLMADFIHTSIATPFFDVIGGRPVIAFRCTPDASLQLLLKVFIDRAGALFAILLLSPLFLVAMIGIRLSSPGPVFFKQMRGGRHGKPFRMWKFRTMHTDAEMRRAELEVFNQMSGPVFKVENDPRITPFGGWLRRTSIDELPQLFNVLTGDMSLVGPRPLPVYEVEKIEKRAQRRRLSVKPGLTCLWQIGGRNEVRDFDDWVRLDLRYIDNWSLWLDIKILLKTIPVVLLGFGAK